MCGFTSERAHEVAPEEIITATQIVKQYCMVIKKTENMKFGAPESMLPHPKQRIREAILMLLEFMNTQSLWENMREMHPEIAESVLTNRYFNILKEAYSRLARFVTAADADLAARANSLFDGNDYDSIQSIRQDLSSAWYKKARDLQRKLNDDCLSLQLELEEEFGKKFVGN